MDAAQHVTRFIALADVSSEHKRKVPYLTLPYGEGVLPPSAEASSGPNAHP